MANDNESEKYTNINDIINALIIRSDTSKWNDIINSIPDKLKDDPLVQTVIKIATNNWKEIYNIPNEVLLENPNLCIIATKKSNGEYCPPIELAENSSDFMQAYLSGLPKDISCDPDLIIATKDAKFIREVLQDSKNVFTNQNIYHNEIILVEAISDLENIPIENVVNDILKDKTHYNLDDDELGYLITSTNNKAFFTEIVKNLENYNLNLLSLKSIPLILSYVNEKYKKNEQTLQNKPLPKDMSFGIEIESIGELTNKLCEQYIQCSSLYDWISKWKFTGESLPYDKTEKILSNNTDENIGSIESVSTVLYENSSDIESIYKMCSLLNTCNHFTSYSCGGHIHIGSNYLKTVRSWINLIELWANTEKIIYAISNDKGDPPRNYIQYYANPISKKIHDLIEEGEINIDDEEVTDDFLEKIIDIQKADTYFEFSCDKYYGINFLNIKKGKDNSTIEFRTSNGTLNPDTWIENINLFGELVKSSYDLSLIQQKVKKGIDITDDEKKKLDAFNEITELENNEENNETKLHDLLDILFDDEEDKKIYINRYESNKDYTILTDCTYARIADNTGPIKIKEIGQLAYKGDDGVTAEECSEGSNIINQQLKETQTKKIGCYDMTDRS